MAASYFRLQNYSFLLPEIATTAMSPIRSRDDYGSGSRPASIPSLPREHLCPRQ